MDPQEDRVSKRRNWLLDEKNSDAITFQMTPRMMEALKQWATMKMRKRGVLVRVILVDAMARAEELVLPFEEGDEYESRS